jgi:hypothetical protein
VLSTAAVFVVIALLLLRDEAGGGGATVAPAVPMSDVLTVLTAFGLMSAAIAQLSRGIVGLCCCARRGASPPC